MNIDKLITCIHALKTWSNATGFTKDNWRDYIQVAQRVQQTEPQLVENALDVFIKEAVREPFTGYTSESKPFLLMRVVFDLPESVPAAARVIFKDWVNWPAPDAEGNVSLAWPISWQTGQPQLVASYEGSEGKPYAAAAEYRHLRANYPPRTLPAA